MQIKCSKCGTPIKIPPEVTASPEPRVACPRCHTRYRLKTRDTTGQPAPPPTDPPRVRPAPPRTDPPRVPLAPRVQPPKAPRVAPSRPGLPRPVPPKTAPPTPPARATPQRPTTASRAAAASSGGLAKPESGTTDSRPTTALSQSPVFSPGDVLAQRYRIGRFLAQGGMGEVYEAEDLELGHEKVALKTISAAAGATGAAAIDRFKREISLARKVTHPNVCRIFDLGQHTSPGRPPVTFLTMELLQGETLAACVHRRERLSPREALPLATQVASALDAAHRAQVIHRDLKSENIFLVREGGTIRAVVTDFGIARGGRDDKFAAMVTGTGIVGTPAYMAPEQVEGSPVTAAADIYAFGVVLYEMVTGHLPFESDNPITMAAKRLQEPPRRPSALVPELEPRWEQVILRCLARQPEERFPSAREVIAALEGVPSPTVKNLHPKSGAFPSAVVPPPSAGSPARPSTGPVAAPVPATFAAGAPEAAPTVAGRGTIPASGSYGTGSAKRRPQALRPLLIVLAAVAAVSAGLWLFNLLRGEGGPRRAPRRSVAVVGFENLSGQAEQEWLGTALAEMLGTELARGERLRTIPGDQVARVKQELGIAGAKELTEERMRQVYAVLGSDFVVSGSFVATPPQLRIDLRLADAAVGRSLASFAHEGSEAELFELVRALGSDVRQRLGVKSDGSGEDPLAGLPTDRQAARLYSEALDSLRRFEPQPARDQLQEAARIEPANPLIHLALSSAWDALGYRQRSADEARQAHELSSDLPREDRLVIQGRFNETRGDWVAAMRSYSTLWDFFPDSLEYGLLLAHAQTEARVPGEALSTIERLRDLPAPSSDDVRIDLAEAAAAAVGADYPRQLEAARRGGDKAAQLGAALLEAEARIAESQAHRFLGSARKAAEAALRAHELYEKVGKPSGSALAELALANAHFDLAQLDEAAANAEEAIRIYRGIGDEGGVASALNNLALIVKKKGDLVRARGLYEDAAKTFEDTGNELGLANALNNRAAILVVRDELEEARAMFKRALAIWEDAGDASGQAYALNNLAAVMRLQGDLAGSRAANEEALEIRRRIGQKLGEVFSLSNLGGVLADLGELQEAEQHLTRCRSLAAEMDHRSALGYCLFELAELRFVQGDLEAARRLHDEALAIRNELGERQTIPESQTALARLKLERGEPAAAELDVRHAMDAFSKSGRRAEEGQATALLTLALLDQQLVPEARRMLADARELGGASEQFRIRFRIRFAAARLAAAGRGTRPALQVLADLEKEAAEIGFTALRLEARLEQLRIELDGGRSPGAAEALAALRQEASSQGMGWISSGARSALERR